VILGPTIFDRNVLAVDKAGLPEALTERDAENRELIRPCVVEEPNHRHRRLLRPRRERPRRCRTADKQDDDIAPPYT
jgi:hypothetical protein